MRLLLAEIRHNPLLWLLVFVPVVFAGTRVWADAHTLLFLLSVLAIVPLATLLSHATESVASRTGDAVGGLRIVLGAEGQFEFEPLGTEAARKDADAEAGKALVTAT